MLQKIKFISGLIMISISLTGCSKEDSSLNGEEHHHETGNIVKLSESSIKLIGLKTESISLYPLKKTVSVPAKVVVNQDYEALVGSLVPGRVQKVLVKAGDYVKEGQDLLFVEGLEIGEIKAGYISAKANLEYNKSNYERQQTLIEQNIGSRKSFLESQSEYEKALAEFNAHDRKIHSIGLTDEELLDANSNKKGEHTGGILAIKSPINGVVVERNVVVGQLIDAATNAFKIIDTKSVWVDGQVYEHELERFSKNSDVVFKPTSNGNGLFRGKISFVGQTIDEETRTLIVRAEFDNSSGKLKPQMYGEMHIQTGIESAAILVPSEAVIKIDNEDYVFVQTNNLQFEKRAVTTGDLHNNLIEVKNGLKEKEKVVVKGSFYLKSELLKGEFGEDEH